MVAKKKKKCIKEAQSMVTYLSGEEEGECVLCAEGIKKAHTALGPSSLLRIGKEQYAPKKAPFGWPFLVCAFLPLLGNRRRIG